MTFKIHLLVTSKQQQQQLACDCSDRVFDTLLSARFGVVGLTSAKPDESGGWTCTLSPSHGLTQQEVVVVIEVVTAADVVIVCVLRHLLRNIDILGIN